MIKSKKCTNGGYEGGRIERIRERKRKMYGIENRGREALKRLEIELRVE